MKKNFLMITAVTGICLLFAINAQAQSDKLHSFEKNKKWGFKDEQGNVVIKPSFQYAHGFSEGLAPVKQDGKWGYIDTKGNFAIQPLYDGAGVFGEGLAPVQQNGKYGYIDKRGNFVIQLLYENAYHFEEGLAAVKQNGRWGFIDPAGNIVIQLLYYDVHSFSEGLACVKLQEFSNYGYIDETGKEIIPYKYTFPSDFSNGIAKVNIFGNYFEIDKRGNKMTNIIQESSLLPYIKQINEYRSNLNPKLPDNSGSFQINSPYLAISAGEDSLINIEKNISILQYSGTDLNEKSINDVKTIIIAYPYLYESKLFYEKGNSSRRVIVNSYGAVIIYYDVNSEKCIGYDVIKGDAFPSDITIHEFNPNPDLYVYYGNVLTKIKSHLATSN